MPSKIHHLVHKMTNIKQKGISNPILWKVKDFSDWNGFSPSQLLKPLLHVFLTATTIWSSMSDMMFSPFYYFDKETMAYCLQLQVEAKRG